VHTIIQNVTHQHDEWLSCCYLILADLYILADLHRCLSHVRTNRGCAAAGPMGKMPRGQPRARKPPPGHAITGQRHSWRRRLKSATSATAVCCPDESCLTVLNGCVEKNRGCDRANGKIASPATVSRLGLGPLDLVVSDCRLQLLAFSRIIRHQRCCQLMAAQGLDPKVRTEPWHLIKAQLSDRIRRLVRCNTRCTLPVVLLVFEPLLFRGVGFRQQPIHVS